MVEIVSKDQCAGCYACYNICPTDSISLKADEEGFAYPKVNISTCIDCGLCNQCCPLQNKLPVPDQGIKAYAAINRCEEERFNSSSGGIFPLLARRVIEKGGIVYGATFNEEFRVVHKGISKVEDISQLCGSKYVQSDIGYCFREVMHHLRNGKLVMFVGTPCQVSGLKNYLGTNSGKNLLLVDLICHGVPSPEVWKSYLNEISGGQRRIEHVNFRYKIHGWRKLHFYVKFKENGKEICQASNKNPYLKGFLNNIILRPSCYSCVFKSVEHPSDLTLADFWGIRHVLPAYYDDRGCSLVLSRSMAAEQIIQDINAYANIQEVDLQEAISHNTALVQSADLPEQRDIFFCKYQEGGSVSLILNSICRESINRKVDRLLKKVRRGICRLLK